MKGQVFLPTSQYEFGAHGRWNGTDQITYVNDTELEKLEKRLQFVMYCIDIALLLERRIGVSRFWISKAPPLHPTEPNAAVSSFRALISGIPVCPCHRSASASIWFPASGGENVQGTTPNYKCGILRRCMNKYY